MSYASSTEFKNIQKDWPKEVSQKIISYTESRYEFVRPVEELTEIEGLVVALDGVGWHGDLRSGIHFFNLESMDHHPVATIWLKRYMTDPWSASVVCAYHPRVPGRWNGPHGTLRPPLPKGFWDLSSDSIFAYRAMVEKELHDDGLLSNLLTAARASSNSYKKWKVNQ